MHHLVKDLYMSSFDSSLTPKTSLIEFPCEFPIKAMALAAPELVDALLNLLVPHDPKLTMAAVTTRPSSGGKYIGVTLTVHATSQEQLDNMYRALTSHPLVKVVL
jgi:hypothetical protein